jgi:hypothetical protein
LAANPGVVANKKMAVTQSQPIMTACQPRKASTTSIARGGSASSTACWPTSAKAAKDTSRPSSSAYAGRSSQTSKRVRSGSSRWARKPTAYGSSITLHRTSRHTNSSRSQPSVRSRRRSLVFATSPARSIAACASS